MPSLDAESGALAGPRLGEQESRMDEYWSRVNEHRSRVIEHWSRVNEQTMIILVSLQELALD